MVVCGERGERASDQPLAAVAAESAAKRHGNNSFVVTPEGLCALSTLMSQRCGVAIVVPPL